MAKVIITVQLRDKIEKIFKKESIEIFDLLLTLEENPKKGKEVGVVGAVVIKELKYKKFRFYFITDGFKVKYLSLEELKDIFIKFVRMSEKKDQQSVINEIKYILSSLGEEGF